MKTFFPQILGSKSLIWFIDNLKYFGKSKTDEISHDNYLLHFDFKAKKNKTELN